MRKTSTSNSVSIGMDVGTKKQKRRTGRRDLPTAFVVLYCALCCYCCCWCFSTMIPGTHALCTSASDEISFSSLLQNPGVFDCIDVPSTAVWSLDPPFYPAFGKLSVWWHSSALLSSNLSTFFLIEVETKSQRVSDTSQWQRSDALLLYGHLSRAIFTFDRRSHLSI